MPLNALPVTPGELEELQAGTTFTTNTGQATSQAALINLDNGVDTVASYAVALLNANIATSQVAMATTCLMWGTTQEIDFLTNTATVAAPLFVALAAQIGTNAVATSAEGVGVALADDPQFQPFLDLNATQFAAAVGVATGVNVGVIGGWLAFWTQFATDNPSVLQPGVTVQEYAYGATFGDAIGVALQNPTTADLQTTVETNAQGELIIGGDDRERPAHHCYGSIRRWASTAICCRNIRRCRARLEVLVIAHAHYRRRYAARVRDRPSPARFSPRRPAETRRWEPPTRSMPAIPW